MRSFVAAACAVLFSSAALGEGLPLNNSQLAEFAMIGCPDARNLRIEDDGTIFFTYHTSKDPQIIEWCVKDKIAAYQLNGFPVNLGDLTQATTATKARGKIILK